MAVIKVYTNDGSEVDSLVVDDLISQTGSAGRTIFGYVATPLGWLGRALRDARMIQQGLDPELPSERAMRLVDEKTRIESGDRANPAVGKVTGS